MPEDSFRLQMPESDSSILTSYGVESVVLRPLAFLYLAFGFPLDGRGLAFFRNPARVGCVGPATFFTSFGLLLGVLFAALFFGFGGGPETSITTTAIRF